ncbi:MAG: succinate dehydrogenase, hydrophobic membrane anchor protein [Gammaproteobacteria bacterium]|nr:succinate dehydrogenase, hydrophobic membrane anchor protein [Gammaproteobacteria bacterium]
MSTGPGSASRHWRNQRLTAISLIPLGLWFVVSLLRQPSLEHAVVAGWFARPPQTLLAVLFGAALLWHSLQGVQIVLEDYVRGRMLGTSLMIARVLHLAAAVALAWALWCIAFGGSA